MKNPTILKNTTKKEIISKSPSLRKEQNTPIEISFIKNIIEKKLEKKICEEIQVYISAIKTEKNEKRTPTPDFFTVFTPVEKIISIYINFKEKQNSIPQINLKDLFYIIKTSTKRNTDEIINKLNQNGFKELTNMRETNEILKTFDDIYNIIQNQETKLPTLLYLKEDIKER